jgi:hypothetical protein
MDTCEWPVDLLSCKLKTARQKKRLQKEDKEKQLIQLYKQHKALQNQKRNLPMVPVMEPYQRGWKRMFVLREDVRASQQATFYQTLLDKINTEQCSHEKSFRQKAKRRKNGRTVYEEREQLLEQFSIDEWNCPKQKLTPEEKLHFHLEVWWNKKWEKFQYRYTFNEPWRFRLRVLPNIITENRALDVLLEQELSGVKSKIERNNLWPLIYKLTNGRKRPWRRFTGDKRKIFNPIKNKNIPTILAEYTNY